MLVETLQALGYTVEVGDNLVLYGHVGDERPERADIVIRRETFSWVSPNKFQGKVLTSSNDIGFARNEQGAYVPIVSQFGAKATRGGNFVRDVRVEYNQRVAMEIGRRLNGMTNVQTEGQLVKYAVRF